MENKRVVNVGGIDVWEGMELETLANNSKFSVGSGMKIVSIYDGGCVCRFGILDVDTVCYTFSQATNSYMWLWVKPRVVDSAAQKGGEKIEFSVGDEVVHKSGDIGMVVICNDETLKIYYSDNRIGDYVFDKENYYYWGKYITKTTTASSAARVEEKKNGFRAVVYLTGSVPSNLTFDNAGQMHDAIKDYLLNGYVVLFSGKVEVEYEYELKQEVRVKG